MKRRMRKAIPLLLATALLWLSFGCGWDSTPQYVIATPKPDYTPFARWTASPVPEGAEPTAAAETTADAEASPAEPGQSAQASAAPDASATPGTSATPDPNASIDPSVTPTPDPYLYGRWEFKRSRYKGQEVPASETKQRILIWLFANGSAEMNIYEISATSDPPENTQGVQWKLNGTTLTLTLYGETILTLIYDGTYLTYEVEVFDDVDRLILEKTGE